MENYTNMIISCLGEILQEIGNKLADSLQKKMGQEGRYYDRTGMVESAFRNPPKVEISGEQIQWSIYNVRAVISFRGKKHKFNHHMSVNGSNKWHNENIPALVPIWLNYGFKMPKGGKHPGYAYYDSVFGAQGIDEYIVQQLAVKCYKIVTKQMK